ncbi:MAG: PilZ domain-containing protein, partial [Hyphomicrobiaceae bacterium]
QPPRSRVEIDTTYGDASVDGAEEDYGHLNAAHDGVREDEFAGAPEREGLVEGAGPDAHAEYVTEETDEQGADHSQSLAAEDDQAGFAPTAEEIELWKEVESQVEDALRRADEAERQLVKLRAELDSSPNEGVARLEGLLATMQGRVDASEKELMRLQAEAADRENTLRRDVEVQRELAELIEAEAQREQESRLEAEKLAEDAIEKSEALQRRVAELEALPPGSTPGASSGELEGLEQEIAKLKQELAGEAASREDADKLAADAIFRSETLAADLAALREKDREAEAGAEALANMESQRDAVQRELDELRKVHDEHRQQLEEASAARQQAELVASQAKESHDGLMAEHEALKEKDAGNAELTDRLAEVERERDALSGELADVKAALDDHRELSRQLVELETELEDMRAKADGQAARLEEAGKTHAALEQRADRLSGEKDALAAELQHLTQNSAASDALEKQLEEATARVADLTQQLEIAQIDAAELSGKHEAAVAAAQSTESESRAAAERIKALEAEVAALNAAASERQAEIESAAAAKAEADRIGRESRKLRELIRSLKDEASTEAEMRKSAEAMAAEAGESIKAAEERAATSQAALAELEAATAEADKELQQELQKLRANIKGLEAKVSEETAARVAAEQSAADVRLQLSEQQAGQDAQQDNDARVAAISRQLDEARAQAEKSHAALDEARQSLAVEKEEREQTEALADAHRERLQDLEQKLQEMAAESAGLQEKIARLEAGAQQPAAHPPQLDKAAILAAATGTAINGARHARDLSSSTSTRAHGEHHLTFEIPSKVPTRLHIEPPAVPDGTVVSEADAASEAVATKGHSAHEPGGPSDQLDPLHDPAIDQEMDDLRSKRRDKRVDAQIPAVLLPEGATQGLTCTIRDKSSSGARVEFTRDIYVAGVDVVSIGDRLTMTFRVGQDRTSVECVVAWVDGPQTGVRFIGQFRTEPQQPRRTLRDKREENTNGKSLFSAGRFAKSLLSGR